MAPKVEAKVDHTSQIQALQGQDSAQITSALNFLLTADIKGFPKEGEAPAHLVELLTPHLSSSDANIRAAGLKLAARLSMLRGPHQRALLTETVLQVLWDPVSEFGEAFPQYQEAYAKLKEEALAPKVEVPGAGKKPPAGKGAAVPAPPDPETLLPGPNKHVLDAALRCLYTLLSADSFTSAYIAAAGNVHMVIRLLEHHSLRVQARAAVLLRGLCRSDELRTSLLVHGLVPAALALLQGTTSGSVKLEVMQALLHLSQQCSGAQHAQLVQGGAVDSLLQLVLTPDVMPAPAAAVPATSESTEAKPPPIPINMAKPQMCTPAELQLSALQLLRSMTAASQAAAHRLATLGGLNLLVAMLPLPPPPAPPPADGTTPAPSPPDPTAAPAVVAAAEPFAAARTLFQALEQEPPPAVFEAGTDLPWHEYLYRSAYPHAPVKAPSSELQRVLLDVISHLLAMPELAGVLLQVAEVAPITTLLLHFFAEPPPAPVAPKPSTLEPPGKGKAAAPAKASAKGKVEEPPPVKAATHMEPPFPTGVKAAALRCLVQLAKHSQFGPRLAADSILFKSVYHITPASADQSKAAAARAPAPAALPTPAISAPAAGPGPGSSLDVGLLEDASQLLQVLLPHLPAEPSGDSSSTSGQLIGHADAVGLLKSMAKEAVVKGSFVAKTCVGRATLLMPKEEFMVPARPPPPSPPPTPPPLPLANSKFVWDALGRPNMIDGSDVKLSTV